MVKSKFEDLLYSYRSTNSSSGITASSKASNKCAWVSLSGILGSQINLCEFVLTSYKCEQVDARRREISPKSAQQFVTYGRHNLPFTLRGRVRLPKPTSREKNFCRFKLVLICHHCYSCCMTKSRLHTPISTVAHAEVVWAPKIVPNGIFLSHSLRSKIIACT